MCSLPASCALKDGAVDAHVTWVVDPRFSDIVRSCDAIDVVVAAKPGFSASSLPVFDAPFDVVLDLQGLLKSALATIRARAAQRVGYHWQREGSGLFTQRVFPDPGSGHIVDQYVDVARAVGGNGDRARFGLTPAPVALASVRDKLRYLGVEERFVAINPGAGWESKRWPVERIVEVSAALLDRGLPVVLIGGGSKDERQIATEICDACGDRVVSMTGTTSVLELVALLSLASAHLGGDTGSTHIAAALGVPAVGLYATTRPERSCPYGQIGRTLYDARGLKFIESEPVIERLVEAAA